MENKKNNYNLTLGASEVSIQDVVGSVDVAGSDDVFSDSLFEDMLLVVLVAEIATKSGLT